MVTSPEEIQDMLEEARTELGALTSRGAPKAEIAVCRSRITSLSLELEAMGVSTT